MRKHERDCEKVIQWIQALEEDDVIEYIRGFVKSNPVKEEVVMLLKALRAGIAGVVESYEKGRYYVGEIICAMEMIAEVESLLAPLAQKARVEEMVWVDAQEENLVEELLTFQWNPVCRTQRTEYA